MGRIPRVLDPAGGIYHVTCRGNNKAFVFREDADKKMFLKIVLRYKRETLFRIFHYVIMGNHFHLIIKPVGTYSLPDIMQRILLSFSSYYRSRHKHVGHLWQGRFDSKLISDDGYLLTSGLYDELNPVRANITEQPEDYRWSSYRFYAFGEPDPLVDRDILFETLGNDEAARQVAYRAMAKMWQKMPRPVPTPP